MTGEKYESTVFWMYFKAVLKIVIPVAIGAYVIPELRGEDPFIVISLYCTLGLAGLIYIGAGILSLKFGLRQARDYIKNYPGGIKVLDEEYKSSEDFFGLRVGHTHAFVDASDGFFILPLKGIVKAYVLHFGENKLKGKPGYYYLYIGSPDTCQWDEKIKVYYISKKDAQAAQECLAKRCPLQEETEELRKEMEEDMEKNKDE